MRPILQYAAALITLGLAAPVQACWSVVSPREKVAGAYEQNLISSVALVRIDKVEPLLPSSGQPDARRYTASVRSVLSGTAKNKTVEFIAPSLCGPSVPVGATGDMWVVYFRMGPQLHQTVFTGFPVAIAYAADPRLPRR